MGGGAMTVPSTNALLRVWEQGQGCSLSTRALLMLGAAVPDASEPTLAATSIGRRDAWLLWLREELFGSKINGLTPCAACAAQIEVAFEARDIRVPYPTENGPFQLSVDGHDVHYRLPDSSDLIAVEAARDVSEAGQMLLARCVEARVGDTAINACDLPKAVISAIDLGMAESDPQANVTLALTCPACGQKTFASFDIVRQLWSDLDDWAQGTLRRVHRIASHYHWSEAAILRMSVPRRQYYLDLIGAS